ncbi:DJ-1/PfpI family protein [Flavobacterium sedimenticola]|uniref:DJ-1/PfpI family protein n=1 Tax=Flavobacterium sedimenticola TaxID=3043286 RepID=A0ABT6XS47_9FLAO|nr:DJ-1/PfpI family protein [Flavobacterium sedimenticola]MDI9257922.1 DJ-1/PfpI family protein [Flavobacterium sedimenticola]
MKNFKFALILFFLSTLIVQAQNKKVIFIMSAAKELKLKNGKSYTETGVFLSEFYLAYKEIVNLGYEVDFATPNGIASSIDKESYKPKYWGKKDTLINEASEFVKQNPKFNQPLTLEQALENINSYQGMVIPGGQGLMVDLFFEPTISKILKDFSKKGRAIGLICHAPALILSIPKQENPFIGYKVNSVTGFEEFFIENFVMKGKPKNRKISKQLKKLGLKYKKGRPGANFAVRDRELITSQNPYSNEAFNKLYLEALKELEEKGTLKTNH